MKLTVIVPTHDPAPDRLGRTLEGLRRQTLSAECWETLIVDNASRHFPSGSFFSDFAPGRHYLLSEPRIGLSHARRRGLSAARGEFAVLVDDDAVLAPDYLERTLESFAALPRVGVLGGKSLPEFAGPAPEWTREFHGALSLRDFGQSTLVSEGLRRPGEGRRRYPDFSPIGAGMGLRRQAWEAWLKARPEGAAVLTDRRGGELASGGDNDIVFCAMEAGWEVAYCPALVLTHLIPPERLSAEYLGRLNRGIHKSWVQVLSLHQANPWPPISPAGARLRKIRAWFRRRPWSSPAAFVRWQGDCGHFEGRSSPMASLTR